MPVGHIIRLLRRNRHPVAEADVGCFPRERGRIARPTAHPAPRPRRHGPRRASFATARRGPGRAPPPQAEPLRWKAKRSAAPISLRIVTKAPMRGSARRASCGIHRPHGVRPREAAGSRRGPCRQPGRARERRHRAPRDRRRSQDPAPPPVCLRSSRVPRMMAARHSSWERSGAIVGDGDDDHTRRDGDRYLHAGPRPFAGILHPVAEHLREVLRIDAQLRRFAAADLDPEGAPVEDPAQRRGHPPGDGERRHRGCRTRGDPRCLPCAGEVMMD